MMRAVVAAAGGFSYRYEDVRFSEDPSPYTWDLTQASSDEAVPKIRCALQTGRRRSWGGRHRDDDVAKRVSVVSKVQPRIGDIMEQACCPRGPGRAQERRRQALPWMWL